MSLQNCRPTGVPDQLRNALEMRCHSWEAGEVMLACRLTPHFHLQTGHAREMLDIVGDHSHMLGYRM
jgi:hypothetical protein